jgi:hypothetical protein
VIRLQRELPRRDVSALALSNEVNVPSLVRDSPVKHYRVTSRVICAGFGLALSMIDSVILYRSQLCDNVSDRIARYRS